MGKIRVKVLGDETTEQQEQEKQAEKRDQKAMREGGKKAHIPGMKGGERTTTVGVSEEEIAAELDSTPVDDDGKQENKGKKQKKEEKVKRVTSKRHLENAKLAVTTPTSVVKGLEVLRKFKPTSIDETVELHINTKEKGINGTISLPHGTGKKLRIKIADDAVIEAISGGKIDFDVLVATPAMMPKLARVAKVLGPRGLMPNPKNGTIAPDPEKAVEKLSAGQIAFKTESAAPIIHASVGKLSFEDKKLQENITALISAIGVAKIASVTLKSTMSPAVRLHVSAK